jgi:glycosyltransferase involved in cell wall biosynthesis
VAFIDSLQLTGLLFLTINTPKFPKNNHQFAKIRQIRGKNNYLKKSKPWSLVTTSTAHPGIIRIMPIQLLVRDYPEKYGLSRYTQSLCQALNRSGVDFQAVFPQIPTPVRAAHKALSCLGYDLQRFFTTYPLKAPLKKGHLTHLTAQQMAVLLHFYPGLIPTVVTVHDIIPHLMRGRPGQDTFRHPFDVWFDRFALSALRKADILIADSEFTRKTLANQAGLADKTIQVIYPGVDHHLFRPVTVPEGFQARYGLDPAHCYILYVGAESPRKNLPVLLHAFAQLRDVISPVKLIKVGMPEYLHQYSALLELIADLGLQKDIIFTGHVSERNLIHLYNLADVFVLPSSYEGFGMPALEAMACGTAVICSRAASLPEVVGPAALLVEPGDVDGLAAAMEQVLLDNDRRQDLVHCGIEQAQKFSWLKTAHQTIDVYRDLGAAV